MGGQLEVHIDLARSCPSDGSSMNMWSVSVCTSYMGAATRADRLEIEVGGLAKAKPAHCTLQGNGGEGGGGGGEGCYSSTSTGSNCLYIGSDLILKQCTLPYVQYVCMCFYICIF